MCSCFIASILIHIFGKIHESKHIGRGIFRNAQIEKLK